MKQGDSIYPEFGNQGGLFDEIPVATLHRNTDPETSRKGAENARQGLSGECEKILSAAKRIPGGDWTARELSDHSGINYYLIQKRQSVIERAGKFCRVNGKIRSGQQVWRLV